MKNPFESRIRSKIETVVPGETVDILINEFPQELQERLENEIEGMDEQTAEDYLVRKLVARKESLVEWSIDSLSKDIVVTHDVPRAVISSIEESANDASKNFLGKGKNGQLFQSIRWPNSCYKVLFLERAKELQLNIVREASLQHDAREVLKGNKDIAQIPEVIGFVQHPDVLAIRMEKISGSSILAIFEAGGEFPPKFDIEVFFQKLEASIALLNQHGYFHRDLTNNAGNVMVDDNGDPWIIDFGSAIKAINPTEDARSYQLTPGGAEILANDLSGIGTLKTRVSEYLREKVK